VSQMFPSRYQGPKSRKAVSAGWVQVLVP